MAVKFVVYNDTKYKISYELINKNPQKYILIMHGWGANKELMHNALNKLDYSQIYVDLPGFGVSDEPNHPFNSTNYTDIIFLFLKELGIKLDAVLGHSFGGKISLFLSQKLKNELKNDDLKIILLSSAGIVWKKSFKTNFKILCFKTLKIFGLGHFRKFFASKDANNLSKIMYETFKNVVDENIQPILPNINNKTLILWGENDDATPLKSANVFNKTLKNSNLEILQGGHFFFLEQNQKTICLINDFLKNN